MKLHPLHLGVKRTVWSTDGLKGRVHSSDPAAARAAVFERDNHTCRFCGFQSRKYQEIHHLNGFEDDLSLDNCLTACIFCHQCFDLQSVSKMESGMLVWLPEISQPALHHIMRAIHIGRAFKMDAAHKALEILSARREQARQRLGTDDPEALAIVMTDFMSHKMYDNAKKQLQGIRLLPLDRRVVDDPELKFYNQFNQIMAYWRSKNGPFANFAPEKWVDELTPVLKIA